ncbi:hypothetical protein F5B22DRAFT_6712 [Xylaria bambusicola]|uniref:uncharacterized protein n=1 Tax=Xylaria bambusicola TaxID=326684 RepID=UPI002007690A|nr:uncharacterized protein F5B22DRAFT_6712 [Xylaria bambusicola]KAI0527838.1 hypothetical protein F5B22DRAFT_6712 [Xylaria bambusicola]
MASLAAQLRGSCQCGRNQYAIQVPSASSSLAQVIFDSDVNHRISSASPLSAFLRVPLPWYHSEVFPFFPDESRSTIRRQYAHPAERHAQRSFCGYCGTPLSYWSEEPRGESEYIQLTLGSLLTEDLHNLQELGLLPDDTDSDEMDIAPSPVPSPGRELIGRDITTVPWFDSLISGSRLGNIKTMKGVRHTSDGTGRVEFEVTEWTADDDNENEEREAPTPEFFTSGSGKRKRLETDGDNNMSTPSAA